MLLAEKIPMGFSLLQLLEGIIKLPSDAERQVFGLSSDSRHIEAGDLLIVYLGREEEFDHYIAEAITQGAVAVLRDAKSDTTKIEMRHHNGTVVPVIAIEKLADYVGVMAARFYHHPSEQMKIIGITGTNGKTSCSHYIARGLEFAGQQCGIIGTLGHGFPDHLQAGVFTTPTAILLQQELAQLKQQNAEAIAMEVSSHALAQNRIGGVAFDTAVFTNLTRDHFDYHGDMDRYAAAKRQLFLQPGLRHAVINADDDFGRKLIEEFKTVYRSMLTVLRVSKPMCH